MNFTWLQLWSAIEVMNAIFGGGTMGPNLSLSPKGCNALWEAAKAAEKGVYGPGEEEAAANNDAMHQKVWDHFDCFGREVLTEEAEQAFAID